MLRKIISGGQTGADRAALDAAIKLDLAHGGWAPKGRRAEDGTIPRRYRLEEMPTESYPRRTEKNIREADGTLILTHGRPTGGSKLTVDTAARAHRKYLHIDLLRTPAFQAVRIISDWIAENDIEVLNVAGSSASKDPAIYDKTLQILTGVYWLDQSHMVPAGAIPHPAGRSEPAALLAGPPDTLEKAVAQLIAYMPLKDKAMLANLTEDELAGLDGSLGVYVRSHFSPGPQNLQLLESCQKKTGNPQLDEGDAAAVIIRELWQHLKNTYKIRVVK
jgi:hypothetical protein